MKTNVDNLNLALNKFWSFFKYKILIMRFFLKL